MYKKWIQKKKINGCNGSNVPVATKQYKWTGKKRNTFWNWNHQNRNNFNEESTSTKIYNNAHASYQWYRFWFGHLCPSLHVQFRALSLVRCINCITHNRQFNHMHTLPAHMHIAPINTLKNQSIKFHLMHPEPPIHCDALPFHSIGIGCNWYTAASDDLIRAIHAKSINSYWMFLQFNGRAKHQKCNKFRRDLLVWQIFQTHLIVWQKFVPWYKWPSTNEFQSFQMGSTWFDGSP